jgi:hypothetical protein
MKGQLLELALIGVVFTVASFLIVIIPFIFTRIHFIETIDAEVVQNNAQLILLSLLSSTYQNKPVYQILIEHAAFNQHPDIEQIMTPRLQKFADCYALQLGDEVISKSADCDPQKYTARVKIVLPYQPDKKVEFLNLTIN